MMSYRELIDSGRRNYANLSLSPTVAKSQRTLSKISGSRKGTVETNLTSLLSPRAAENQKEDIEDKKVNKESHII